MASLPFQVPVQAREPIRLQVSAGGSGYAVRKVEIRRAATTAGVSPSSAQRGQPAVLRASLRATELNRPLAGREVSFLIDGRTVGTARTNARGLATLRFAAASDLALGSRELIARFAGDAETTATEARATLAVTR